MLGLAAQPTMFHDWLKENRMDVKDSTETLSGNDDFVRAIKTLHLADNTVETGAA